MGEKACPKCVISVSHRLERILAELLQTQLKLGIGDVLDNQRSPGLQVGTAQLAPDLRGCQAAPDTQRQITRAVPRVRKLNQELPTAELVSGSVGEGVQRHLAQAGCLLVGQLLHCLVGSHRNESSDFGIKSLDPRKGDSGEFDGGKLLRRDAPPCLGDRERQQVNSGSLSSRWNG